MNDIIYCNSCGSANPKKAKFCSQCGSALLEMDSTAMPSTEANANKHIQTEAVVCKRKKVGAAYIFKIVRAGFLILFAILFVILSICPVVKFDKKPSSYNYYYDYSYYYNDTTIKIGLIDSAKMFINSLFSEDNSDIINSALYEKNQELTEELYKSRKEKTSDELFTEKEIQLVEAIEKNNTLLQLRRETEGPQIFALFSFLFGLALLVICILLLAFSIKNLFDFFFKKTTEKLPAHLLCTVLPLDIIYYFFAKLSVKCVYETNQSPLNIKIDSPHVWIIVLAALAFLIIMIPNFIKTRKSVKIWISRGIVLVFCIVMMFALFFPIFTAEIQWTFKGDSSQKKVNIPLYSDYYEYLDSGVSATKSMHSTGSTSMGFR